MTLKLNGITAALCVTKIISHNSASGVSAIKLFKSVNYLIFVISWSVFPSKLFKPSLANTLAYYKKS